MQTSDPQTLATKSVVGSDGEKIGSVDEVYLDTATGAPEWVSVKTGWFGNNISLVPIAAATERNGDLEIPFSKDKVSNAPNHEQGHDLSPAQEQELYSYYGVSDAPDGRSSEAGREVGTPAGESVPSAGGSDDAMTRSEEQVRVGKENVETGRVRLRKYVVTENVTQTVPVSHEEVRLESEPITEANRGTAMSGPEITEDEHEVVLHGERPTVEKETQAVERVHLGKETHTEEQKISEDVRKERIEMSDDRPDAGRSQ